VKITKKRSLRRQRMAAASAAVLSATAIGQVTLADNRDNRGSSSSSGNNSTGRYVTGDFHNHTTCSDGTLSLQKLVDKSAGTFDLDWFVQAGHGGNSTRNCTLAEDPFTPVPPALGLDPATTIPSAGQPASSGKGPNQLWINTLPNGAAGIKGDVVPPPPTDGSAQGPRAMWKWQEVQEFIYPVIERESHNRDKPIFVGLEQNSPGHEHVSTGIIDGQLPARGAGNATAVAQYEYCFDRSDTDQSRGANNQWDCTVPGSSGNSAVDPIAKKINIKSGVGSGTAGHAKTLEGIKWMSANSPDTSYFVPAHLERAGAFNPDGNGGYNIEHLRDFNNIDPDIAFGFESMPGHQAEASRGSYTPSAVGGGTFGGVGIYAAAVGGVWDALLGEGRRWFFFGSSDFHNRGAFGPDQRESTADFFPGEFTRDYVAVERHYGRVNDRSGRDRSKFGTQEIVDGLRSGNSFVSNGDLIDHLSFVACSVPNKQPCGAEEAIAAAADFGDTFKQNDCATMGETLTVKPGNDVVVIAVMRDPEGTNNSPYSFPNPSLKTINVKQPINAPVLDHVDLISGNITGKVSPSDTAHYAGLIGSPAASNPSAKLAATFNKNNWKSKNNGKLRMSYRISSVSTDQYVRLRGTNLPPATPYETDPNGNPLLDFGTALKIPCTDAACPNHLATATDGSKTSSFDVAAWSDLWFYSNPIFIRVQSKGPRK
jgi:hypothetical protein